MAKRGRGLDSMPAAVARDICHQGRPGGPIGHWKIAGCDQPQHACQNPTFTDSDSVQSWIDERSLAYGGKRNFFVSEEYRLAYPKIKKVIESERTQHSKKIAQEMKARGVSIGDEVVYAITSGLGMGTLLHGKVVKGKAGPRVRLDLESAAIAGKKSVSWSPGWHRRVQSNAGRTVSKRKLKAIPAVRYCVHWWTKVDRPERRGPSLPRVDPGTALHDERCFDSAKRAVAYMAFVTSGEWDFSSEYVMQAWIDRDVDGHRTTYRDSIRRRRAPDGSVETVPARE